MSLPKVNPSFSTKRPGVLIDHASNQRIIKVSVLAVAAHRAILMSISQETERLVADPAPGITAAPHEDNLRYFDVTIQGPDGSPFQRL